MRHDWNDDTFDWESLNEGIRYIHDYMVNWGRIGVHSKEKWGTARIHVYFWRGSLHELVYPGYVYNQFPDWLWKFDCNYINPFLNFTKIPTLVNKWQFRVYKDAYAKAIKKWPHIAKELTCCADYPDLLALERN